MLWVLAMCSLTVCSSRFDRSLNRPNKMSFVTANHMTYDSYADIVVLSYYSANFLAVFIILKMVSTKHSNSANCYFPSHPRLSTSKRARRANNMLYRENRRCDLVAYVDLSGQRSATHIRIGWPWTLTEDNFNDIAYIRGSKQWKLCFKRPY